MTQNGSLNVRSALGLLVANKRLAAKVLLGLILGLWAFRMTSWINLQFALLMEKYQSAIWSPLPVLASVAIVAGLAYWLTNSKPKGGA